MAYFFANEPVVVEPGDPIIFSEKLFPREEDPEVTKFGDFCEKYYKELFGQDLPLWQRSFLEHCFKSKELLMNTIGKNPCPTATEETVLKLIMEYDRKPSKEGLE